MTRMTAKQFRESEKPAKRPKYGNRKTTVDGIEFDSKAEASYYCALKVRERAGEVSNVQLQPRFMFVVDGILVTTYKPDFQFFDAVEKRTRVVDVKGFRVRDLSTKLKLMRALHKINVEIVK